MASIIDYLCSEFDSFDERPLGDVDSLILSWLSYYRLPDDGAVSMPRGAAFDDLYRAKSFGVCSSFFGDDAFARYLLAALVANPRFAGMRISNYREELDEQREKQFSAMTFSFPCGISYVAFRGTDNTLVGWKEDFNLAYERELPSQTAARDYLEQVAGLVSGPICTGGHSKGGNLALYAAMTCSDDVAKRLCAAFSHDGPGFTPEMMASPAWVERAGLVRKTIPNQSFIGMIFEDQGDVDVVVSNEQGILQHNPFSWEVEGTEFKRAENLALGARHVDKSLNRWVASMDREQREQFVETLFSIIEAGGEKTFADLGENWTTTVPAMIEFVNRMPEESRDSFRDAVGDLFRSMVPDLSLKRIATSIADGIDNLTDAAR